MPPNFQKPVPCYFYTSGQIFRSRLGQVRSPYKVNWSDEAQTLALAWINSFWAMIFKPCMWLESMGFKNMHISDFVIRWPKVRCDLIHEFSNQTLSRHLKTQISPAIMTPFRYNFQHNHISYLSFMSSLWKRFWCILIMTCGRNHQ